MLSTIKRLAGTTAVTALVLAFSGVAQGQDRPFAVGYFSYAHTAAAPDGTLRLVNDGAQGASSPGGDLCASVYVFDNTEELQECCSCLVTPNGYLALGVNSDLTGNTLTGRTLKRGVVKVMTVRPSPTGCDPTFDQPLIGIREWLTHIEKVGTGFQVSVEDLKESELGSAEEADLVEDCTVAIELGTGAGKCACTDVGR